MAEAGEPGVGQRCVVRRQLTGRQPPVEPRSSAPSHRAPHLPSKAAAAAGGAACVKRKKKTDLFPIVRGKQSHEYGDFGVLVGSDILHVLDVYAFRLPLGCS